MSTRRELEPPGYLLSSHPALHKIREISKRTCPSLHPATPPAILPLRLSTASFHPLNISLSPAHSPPLNPANCNGHSCKKPRQMRMSTCRPCMWSVTPHRDGLLPAYKQAKSTFMLLVETISMGWSVKDTRGSPAPCPTPVCLHKRT
jgi:hypothetical protein